MAKLEKIKRRGVKWILGELDFHYKYNDLEYLSKLKALDLLSLECKFRLTDLILFHDIVYNISTINLHDYIIQADNEAIAANNNTLRQYINPPLYPAGYSLEFDLESKRAKSKLDSLSFNIMIDISVNMFKDSFFVQSALQWYKLPIVKLRKIVCKDGFKSSLTSHLWLECCSTDTDVFYRWSPIKLFNYWFRLIS